ncbi:MAG: hypothetical protein IJS71_08465 [Clostridia bacterium]|nr:hypothetical protein [Clostridia bacterium]
MKITLTIDIENCYDCPYRHHYTNLGLGTSACGHSKANPYLLCETHTIPNKCPLLKAKGGEQNNDSIFI